MQTNTTYQYNKMYQYIEVYVNTDKYLPYIPIRTINLIQVNTAQYLQIQLNTF